MAGIDLREARGSVAYYENQGPGILGVGATMQALADVVRARQGDDGLSAPAAVAVPAWSNDVQRQASRDEATSAGFKEVYLVNRPTAAAMALAAARGAVVSPLVVLELASNAIDVTVMTSMEHHYEVLATDGVMELDPVKAGDPEALCREVEAVIHRALKGAGMKVNEVADLLCAGDATRIKSVEKKLETSLGWSSASEVHPDQAIPLGAAIHAALMASRGKAKATPAEPTPAAKGGGCLIVLAVLVLLAVLLL